MVRKSECNKYYEPRNLKPAISVFSRTAFTNFRFQCCMVICERSRALKLQWFASSFRIMIFFIPMRSDTTLRSLDNTDFPIDSVFQILSQTPNLTCGYVCEGGQGRTKIKKSFPLRPTSTRGLWLDITLPNFFNGHGWGIYDHNCSDALDRCSKRTPTLLPDSRSARGGIYSRLKRKRSQIQPIRQPRT